MTKKRPRPEDVQQDVTTTVHKAFRRMAFIFANLVCGIWLVLLVAMTAADDSRPEIGALAVMILLSAPVAYLIPYGLVRAIGLVLAYRKGRRA